MGYEKQFDAMLPHTIQLTAPTGKDNQGRSTYAGGSPTSYKGRVVGALTSLRTVGAVSEAQEFILYLNMGADNVTDEYQVTLPNDPAFGTGHPFIYSIERLTDNKSHHHVKIVCGYAFHHQTKL